MDCSLPGSSVRGILQSRILEWVAFSFWRGSSWPRDQTCIFCIGSWILHHWATWEYDPIALLYVYSRTNTEQPGQAGSLFFSSGQAWCHRQYVYRAAVASVVSLVFSEDQEWPARGFRKVLWCWQQCSGEGRWWSQTGSSLSPVYHLFTLLPNRARTSKWVCVSGALLDV